MRSLTDAEVKRLDELTKPPLNWPVEQAEYVVRTDTKMEEVIKANPGLHPMTAHIIAGDLMSAERWHEKVERGEAKPEEVVNMIGSYARWDYAIKHCAPEWVWKHIAELWRGSDPNDTDRDNLEVWRDAFFQNDERYIRDGAALPRTHKITVYRGQMPNDPLGIAWTTDIEIAKKFAGGAGQRMPMNGSVIEGWTWRGLIWGYLTGRGESEVIVDPADVHDAKIVGYFS
jgi:hypothetical protein